MNRPLGRRKPTDFKHVIKYKLAVPRTIDNVEKVFKLPDYHWQHDQGNEGACVGFGSSMMMAILNEMQSRSLQQKPFVHLYNSFWLYKEAQKVDEWNDTPPEEGTSVRAAMDILRTLGHQRAKRKVFQPASISEGIKENKWAWSVDEMRTAIAQGKPIAIGVTWYADFDTENLEKKGREMFIKPEITKQIRGGHCVCIYGASDKRQAFKVKNSWGKGYPLVWMPYKIMERLLKDDGEATLITDL